MYVFDDKDNFRVNLRRSLQMALIAKVKRFLSPKIIKAKNKYIHIGCGYHKFNNFDNLDFYNSSFSFWKKKNYISHDFRYKLPFEDDVYEGAFSEHTLEHLYFKDAKFLLSEICRVLKKLQFLGAQFQVLIYLLKIIMKKRKMIIFQVSKMDVML